MDGTSPGFCSQSTARRDRQRQAPETMGRCDWSPPEVSASCDGDRRDKSDPGLLRKICRPETRAAAASRLSKRDVESICRQGPDLPKGKAFLFHGIWLADQGETKVYARHGPVRGSRRLPSI